MKQWCVDKLTEASNQDIRTVNSSTIEDISSIIIDDALPVKRRIEQFLNSMDNPYILKSDDILIKIRFGDQTKLEDRLINIIGNQ